MLVVWVRLVLQAGAKVETSNLTETVKIVNGDGSTNSQEIRRENQGKGKVLRLSRHKEKKNQGT